MDSPYMGDSKSGQAEPLALFFCLENKKRTFTCGQRCTAKHKSIWIAPLRLTTGKNPRC